MTYLGIDLGTTNSSAAVFDGNTVVTVRNSSGAALTPSVVRIDARGHITVGVKARKLLDTDPANVKSEFKRLMGSAHRLAFLTSQQEKTPVELSAMVLLALRLDVKEQFGWEPLRAVVTVPALFDLPQTAATVAAAKLAGFTEVQLLQEPVASALAAGWSAQTMNAPWLIYDLGGGTFDASLVATRQGQLSVTGHDGDNFLGGRDFDSAIVDHVLAMLQKDGTKIDAADPRHLLPLKKLRAAAEEAKIELSRATEASITLPALFDDSIDVDVVLTRDKLEELIAPLVERSIGICKRLLERHDCRDLERVVLVGGPTATPALRAQVAKLIGVPIAEGFDAMTLVAHGAAVFAAMQNLSARAATSAPNEGGEKVALHYPGITSDPQPILVGRVVGATKLRSVVVERPGSPFKQSCDIDADGAFTCQLELVMRSRAVFKLSGRDDAGNELQITPNEVAIVHGLSLAEVPLPRSVGIALANDRVLVFAERGAAIPAGRRHRLHTVETLGPDDSGYALRVPIVQGEFPLAHLCRLVGNLEIPTRVLQKTLPAGSAIDVSVRIGRGEKLSISATIESQGVVIDHVEQLVTPQLPPEQMEKALNTLEDRIGKLYASAYVQSDTQLAGQLRAQDAVLRRVRNALDGARDPDAIEQARTLLNEVEGAVSDVEAAKAWPDLEQRINNEVSWALSENAERGTDVEKRMLQQTVTQLEKAQTRRDAREVARLLSTVQNLGNAAFYRQEDAWDHMFDMAASHLDGYRNLPEAERLVREGRKAQEKKDRAALERITRELWSLKPPDDRDRQRAFHSGVRV